MAKTTIQTSTETRDKLVSLGSTGSTLDETIRMLIEHEEARRARQALLLDRRLAAARDDADAVAWATEQADRLVALAGDRGPR